MFLGLLVVVRRFTGGLFFFCLPFVRSFNSFAFRVLGFFRSRSAFSLSDLFSSPDFLVMVSLLVPLFVILFFCLLRFSGYSFR